MAVDHVARAMAMDAASGAAPMDTYTKSETDALLEQKADKSEVTESVTAAVAQIVADAPEDFDTLKEMSDWIASHEDSAAAMNSAIADNTAAIANKVDKVSGKDLSTNDFTDADKSKLDSLENYDDTDIKAAVAEVAGQVAINKNTLGYQRKNLLMNNCKTTTKNGVTATVNDDKSITLSGVSSKNNDYLMFVNMATGVETSDQFAGNKKFLPDGEYILKGGSTYARVQVTVSATNTTASNVASSAGEDVRFTIGNSNKYVWFRLLIRADADFSTPVTIYPMIRLAEITDDTYEPYKPSVEERLAALEEKLAAL